MEVPPLPRTPGGSGRFFEAYTQGLTTTALERLFTRDTPEAYRVLTRAVDFEQLKALPWHRRALAHARLAGIPSDRIVNCWPLERLLAWIAEPTRECRSPAGAPDEAPGYLPAGTFTHANH